MSLLVAELVTNVLKHSLAQEQRGTIWVDMRCLQQDELELTVCDSRKTSPGDQTSHEPRIANAFVQILSGKIDVLRDDGYTRVRFRLKRGIATGPKPSCESAAPQEVD
jgi:two-component sensor histidine kinase